MKKEFDTLRASRKLMLKLVRNLNEEQLNSIPDGFSNNIIWNLGHLVVTQQMLWYGLANLDLLVPDEMVQKYKKGTTPTGTVHSEEIQTIKDLAITLPENSIADYNRGIFTSYSAYMTSVNVELATIIDAIKFNNYHEGLHVGAIMTLRKLV